MEAEKGREKVDGAIGTVGRLWEDVQRPKSGFRLLSAPAVSVEMI